jgi:hypothetical protein
MPLLAQAVLGKCGRRPTAGSIPSVSPAERSDVGHVMPPMPGVEGERLLQLERLAALRMHVLPVKVGRGELTEQQDPAMVQALEQIQR